MAVLVDGDDAEGEADDHHLASSRNSLAIPRRCLDSVWWFVGVLGRLARHSWSS